jgi:hypothetical protein
MYAHYTVKKRERGPAPGTEERLVLARRVHAERLEERLAQNEAENREYKFYAFVSHAEGGEDERWARRLQRGLGKYRIPTDAVSELRREEYAAESGLPDLGAAEQTPERLRVARAAAVSPSISPTNLARWLIVVCSPRGAKSERVERDTKDFAENGKEDYVIPFIIGGEPAGSKENRCYPPSMPADMSGISLSGADREEAFIRVAARLLRVNFSRLYQRRLRQRRRFLARALLAVCAVLALLSGLTAWAVSKEVEAARRRTEADELARFLVEEIRGDPRVPEGVRSMIGEHVREYCKRRKG